MNARPAMLSISAYAFLTLFIPKQTHFSTGSLVLQAALSTCALLAICSTLVLSEDPVETASMEGDADEPECQVLIMVNEEAAPAAKDSLVSPWPEMEISIDNASNDVDYERIDRMKELHLLLDEGETPPEIRDIVLTSLKRPEEVVSTSAELDTRNENLELPKASAALSVQEQPSSSPSHRSHSSSASMTSFSLSTGPATNTSDDGARYMAKKARLSALLASTTSLIGTVKSALKDSSLADKKAAPKKLQEADDTSEFECTSCLEDLPSSKMFILRCRHPYCSACFTSLISTAMQTESMFPPKCCLTEIPLKDILTALDEPQKELYKSKAAEYSLKPESRWYCPNAECGKWIPPGKLHKLRILGARCPGCYTRICGYCRGTSHEDGVDCPEDFGLEATIEEAERQGWRRCYKCRTLVELTVGCRHITCRCKAQFCYTCGAKWRTCSCTEVDQERRQAEIVERRNARNAQSREEEEEIARAISEIKAMEHREAQERARETAERERIEALKRALEADERIWRERLESLEREKRRKEEEEAAQKREEAIRVSVTERIDYLQGALLEIQQFQQSSLISRHNNAAAALNEENHAQEAVDKSELDDLQVKLASNSALRHTLLQSAHESKVAELASEHEAEEDDTFMSMQEHLRGKPNREARVKAALDKLQQRQKGVMNILGEEHGKKTKLLKENVAMETKALEAGYSLRSEDRKTAFDESSSTLKRTVVAERKLFEVVAERRKNMMAELQSRLWSDMEQVCHHHGSSAEGTESSSSSGTVAQGKQKNLLLPSFMEPASAALCPAVVGA